MKVAWCPSENERASGVASYASWENPDLQAAIEKAFNTSPRETITRVEINRDGIKAFFETKNACR
jgi:hypothetical protein